MARMAAAPAAGLRLQRKWQSRAVSSSCFLGLDCQKIHLNLPKSSPYPGLQLLELLLPSLQCQLLSLIQTVLQVLHSLFQVLLHPLQVGTGVSLHLLLQPQGFIPAPDLSIQSALHGIHNSLVVSLHLFNFLIFLCYLPVNLRFDLVELKLQAQDLPLLMFQGGLKKKK
uniref:Uncharacterized protein n=1 Tax=Zosterops lateralis melanops TaxID=1220523 RepID=A0A8D2QUZ0_ZOSLA